MIRKFSAREERCGKTCRWIRDRGCKSVVASGRLRIRDAEKLEEVRIDFEAGDGASQEREDSLRARR